ncbi:hypothetical protein C4K10_3301 [Pseudomonas chlororaphis subsp. aureofaciens]|nr:hypothetical protein C4K16_3262 [Pseudomonas chlororaphis subsp. aurantiaca]AZD79856.1 hypothetical protein C4K15_3289 [Pseudomonas chlororaphis subsp. aurantiaca]AZE11581.1 hypothetical protein C4K10_3301 [Pseudomonas chlororaphis subsp. aureofaciens]
MALNFPGRRCAPTTGWHYSAGRSVLCSDLPRHKPVACCFLKANSDLCGVRQAEASRGKRCVDCPIGVHARPAWPVSLACAQPAVHSPARQNGRPRRKRAR